LLWIASKTPGIAEVHYSRMGFSASPLEGTSVGCAGNFLWQIVLEMCIFRKTRGFKIPEFIILDMPTRSPAQSEHAGNIVQQNGGRMRHASFLQIIAKLLTIRTLAVHPTSHRFAEWS